MPTIQNRRATAAQWNAADPVLAAGEIGFEIDTNSVKMGDGLTPWKTLPYLADESIKTLVETGRLSEEALNATYPTHAQLMEVATGQDAALTSSAVAGVLGTEGDPARLVVDGLIDGAIADADKADLIDGRIDPAQLIGTGANGTGIRVDTTVGTRVFVGDVMIYADTGWRDVSSLLINGWKTRHMHIRRIDDMAYLRATVLNAANATDGVFLPLMSGFYRWPSGSDSQVAIPGGYSFRVGGNTGGLSLDTTSGIHYFTAMWPTYQSWLTELPGVPA